VSTQNKVGQHQLHINSSVLTANYDGNISLTKLGNTIQQHVNYYFNPNNTLPSASNEVFTFVADVKPHPIISQLLWTDLTSFSGIKINAKYNANQHDLH